MSERMTVSYQKKPCYDIIFERDFQALSEELKALDFAQKKLCIITDSNVGALYASEVEKAVSSVCADTDIFTFSAGEENKNLDTVKALYSFLIEKHYTRKDCLAALGGGVTGDLTGFAAATYLRGIDFIQIPTTLLSQVDSSIGGKTGVDFDQYKNMVGAFHMPRLVYMNLSTLSTLEPRQYYSGFAEAMKSALISDARYYEWLVANLYEICDREPDAMEEMVRRSCDIKRKIVENDPTEKGERALLNLGHTIGHAVERPRIFPLPMGSVLRLDVWPRPLFPGRKSFFLWKSITKSGICLFPSIFLFP